MSCLLRLLCLTTLHRGSCRCRQKKERKEHKRRSRSTSRSRSRSKRRREQPVDGGPAHGGRAQEQPHDDEQQVGEALDADAAEAAAWEAAARLVASLEADGAPPEAAQQTEEELAGYNPEAYDWSALDDAGGMAADQQC